MQENTDDNLLPQEAPRRRWLFVFAPLVLVAFFIGIYMSTAPLEFPTNTLIEIKVGSSLNEIGGLLKERHVIRSRMLFVIFVRLYGDEKAISAGSYIFSKPEHVVRIARRLAQGEHGIAQVRVTIFEGTSVKQMGALLEMSLPGISKDAFIKEAASKEGYLFPDTYFFFSTATTGPVLSALEKNFEEKTRALANEARVGNKNWHEIVTMASIVEEETATAEDRRIVSGILWNRLEKGMRLQVDAPFVYLIGKGSALLTAEDLNIDSPYNTYRYGGLPPGPISNPGGDAIEAALRPAETPYLFYLSDKEGTIHYAKTFEEHKLNKSKYLQ